MILTCSFFHILFRIRYMDNISIVIIMKPKDNDVKTFFNFMNKLNNYILFLLDLFEHWCQFEFHVPTTCDSNNGNLECWLLSRATKTTLHERSIIGTLSKVSPACASNVYSECLKANGEFFWGWWTSTLRTCPTWFLHVWFPTTCI